MRERIEIRYLQYKVWSGSILPAILNHTYIFVRLTTATPYRSDKKSSIWRLST